MIKKKIRYEITCNFRFVKLVNMVDKRRKVKNVLSRKRLIAFGTFSNVPKISEADLEDI